MLILTFALSVIHIYLPGLGYEEAYLITPAANLIGWELPVTHLGGGLFKQDFNFLMINSYVGIYPALVYVPMFFIFGVNVITIRLTKILFNLFMISVFYIFLRKNYDTKFSFFATFLMSTLPYNIFMYRHGYLDDGVLSFFVIISLWLVNNYLKNKDKNSIPFLFMILGLGAASKLNFVWFIAGLFLSLYITKIKINFDKKTLMSSFFSFFIPLIPNILFNITRIFDKTKPINTLIDIKSNFFITNFGHNNLNIIENLIQRIDDLRYIFNTDQTSFLKYSNPIYFLFLVFVLAYFLFSYKNEKKMVKIVYVSFLVTFLGSIFIPSLPRVEHLTMLLPLSFVLMGRFLVLLYKKNKIAVYSLVFLITLFNILVIVNSYDELNNQGKLGFMYRWIHPSDSIYSVNEYLVENNITSPVVIGPGFRDNLLILSEGVITPVMCEDEDLFEDCLDIENNDYFLSSHIYYGWRQEFYDVVNQSDKEIKSIQVFRTKKNLSDIHLIMTQ